MKDEMTMKGDMMNEKKMKYDEYDCEQFCKKIMEAEEIKSNPAKMKAAMSHVGKMKKTISSMEELKSVASSRRKEMSDDDYMDEEEK